MVLLRYALWLLPLVSFANSARADLQVSPMRVLFDDGDHAASVNLKHLGEKTTRYRISLHFYKFTEAGELTEVKEPTLERDHFAGPLVRFSPRMVTLEPGVTQAVRLLVRKDAALPPGEYRAHIEFQTFEEGDAELMATTTTADKVAMSLKAHRAIAIPVIVRHGALQASVSMSKMRLLPAAAGAPPFLSVALGREGTRSVFGDFSVDLQSADGESRPVGVVHGASVYDAFREFRVPLELGKVAPGDRLRVSFKDGDTSQETTGELKLSK